MLYNTYNYYRRILAVLLLTLNTTYMYISISAAHGINSGKIFNRLMQKKLYNSGNDNVIFFLINVAKQISI